MLGRNQNGGLTDPAQSGSGGSGLVLERDTKIALIGRVLQDRAVDGRREILSPVTKRSDPFAGGGSDLIQTSIDPLILDRILGGWSLTHGLDNLGRELHSDRDRARQPGIRQRLYRTRIRKAHQCSTQIQDLTP
jgi:hypothetical protein